MSSLGPEVFPTKARQDRIGNHWVPVLEELPLFEGMSTRQLSRIPARARRFGPDEQIVREGDPGNAFYVILEGEVRVEPPGRKPLMLKAGDYFGEMALLDGAPRSADITAVGEVTVMVVGRSAFVKLVHSEPRMAQVLLGTLAARLRAAQEQY